MWYSRLLSKKKHLLLLLLTFLVGLFVSVLESAESKYKLLDSSMAVTLRRDGTPALALLGAGLFVKDQYVGILGNLTDTIRLKFVWSRSQVQAEEVVNLVKGYANAVPLHGDDGLNKVLQDPSIYAVAIVLPAQVQPEIVIRALRAGKHVIQEKPVGPNVKAALEILEAYRTLQAGSKAPIWAVAENYRFEPGLMEAGRMVQEIGKIMMVEVVVEAPMTSGNRYFSSSWRRDPNFMGAFLVDGGVHFIAGLRMIVGSAVTAVSAMTTHMETTLPPPDNLAAIMQFANGASGVLAMSYSAKSRKVSWRVVGSNGTVEAERGSSQGQHGYKATLYPPSGPPQTQFFPFMGVQEELSAFALDVARAFKQNGEVAADPRSSALEAIQDLAVVEAMVQSGVRGQGQVAVQQVQ